MLRRIDIGSSGEVGDGGVRDSRLKTSMFCR